MPLMMKSMSTRVQRRVAAPLLGDAADQDAEVLRHHALHDVLIERLVAAAFGGVAEVGDVAELAGLAVLACGRRPTRRFLGAGGSTFIEISTPFMKSYVVVVHDLFDDLARR